MKTIPYSSLINLLTDSITDLVLWDSHPLALGATPLQTFIDGISQLDGIGFIRKPRTFQEEPKTPDFNKEMEEAIKYEGLPPLEPERTLTNDVLTFTNVGSLWIPTPDGVSEVFSSEDIRKDRKHGTVIVQNGKILCAGLLNSCAHIDARNSTAVDLKGGSITPGLVHYGSTLGMQHIGMEDTTTDGIVPDSLTGSSSSLLGHGAVSRAVDGLQFSSRDAL